MNLLYRHNARLMVSLLGVLLIFVAGATAQSPAGVLRGQVTDPSGAAVAGATVVVLPAEGASSTATTTRHGSFEFKTLPPGKYTVQVFAQSIAQFVTKDCSVN